MFIKRIKIILCATLIFAATVPAFGAVEPDKKAHFIVSFAMSSGAYIGLREYGYSRKRAYVSAVFISFGVGLTKEAFDSFNGIRRGQARHFKLDEGDLVADILGAALAPALIWEF